MRGVAISLGLAGLVVSGACSHMPASPTMPTEPPVMGLESTLMVQRYPGDDLGGRIAENVSYPFSLSGRSVRFSNWTGTLNASSTMDGITHYEITLVSTGEDFRLACDAFQDRTFACSMVFPSESSAFLVGKY